MNVTKGGLVMAMIVLSAATFVIGRATAADPTMAGFEIREVRFDESTGGKKPTPEVPKGWRFVGVSNGEKRNSNNLWFQAQDGTIYVMRGFADSEDFVMQPQVAKLNVAKK